MNNKAKMYAQNELQSKLNSADPHQIILMLYDGAIERLSAAKIFMKDGNHEYQGNKITAVMDILHYLQLCLNYDADKELCETLDYFYAQMQIKLFYANKDSDVKKLETISNSLINLKKAWEVIPPDKRMGYLKSVTK